jgi:5'-deoxynucleotidase YfbR-like HD superfamily hydrolase
MIDNLLSIRQGGNVKRFHTRTMLREHLVSSHSWGVATLVLAVHPLASADLLKAALYHDVAEGTTGDIAAPTKWEHPELAAAARKVEQHVEKYLGIEPSLTTDEEAVLKFCDMGDLILSCIEERNLGNREAGKIIDNGLNYLRERAWPSRCLPFISHFESLAKE